MLIKSNIFGNGFNQAILLYSKDPSVHRKL